MAIAPLAVAPVSSSLHDRPSLPVRGLAWTGAALFAAALGRTACFYAWTLETPAPAGGGPAAVAVAWNVAAFTIFAAHHSLLARSGLKARLAGLLTPRLERTAYVWVASLLLLGVTAVWWRVPGVVYELHGPAVAAGIGLQLAGVAMTIAGARVLDPLDLAGLRQAYGRPGHADIRLVWPYTLVRHPIYLGWLLMVFGAPVMTADRLTFAAVSAAYLFIAMPWEERSLSAAAGPAYQAYCRRVRWRILPGLY